MRLYSCSRWDAGCSLYKSNRRSTEAYLNVIGHPDDDDYPVDYRTLAEAAKEYHVLLELNSASMNPGYYRCKKAEECNKKMLDYCKERQSWWWSMGMSSDYIRLRGLEGFMCDLILEPEWVHRMFDMLCKGKLAMLDFLESNGLLSQNVEGSYVGSGGFGFTGQLPVRALGERITTADMWGFCESQATVSVSLEMYGEFIFPYHRRILERFGMNCYGCCEPYDPNWKYIQQFSRLRRVSVSPWSKWKTVPELLGKNYIASVKPSPTPLAAAVMNDDVVRADCRRAVEETKGGICEFIMKDNHTLGGTPRNAVRWVEIMREEIDRVYR